MIKVTEDRVGMAYLGMIVVTAAHMISLCWKLPGASEADQFACVCVVGFTAAPLLSPLWPIYWLVLFFRWIG